ncbi:MAG: glycosyltransferase [Leptospira sp.]|nr:glycosyltransferase [Leptospira sp.]
MIVYQHIDEYHPYDGMGNDTRGFREFFNLQKIENHIITRNNRSQEKAILGFQSPIKESKENIHILHYGGSGYPLDFFMEKKGRKFLRFHNITPSHFFQGGNPGVYLSMEKFYRKTILELNSMENRIELSLCDSDYNAETLHQWSNISSVTVPIMRSYISPSNPKKNLESGRKKDLKSIRLVYVSRFVPNKKIEDLLRLLLVLKNIFPNSYLNLVGNPVSGIDDYYLFLKKMVDDFGLKANVKFHLGVDESEKYRILSESDFFLCMSEHEGFGIPLIEAMEAGVPVIAYESSAIAETMKEGGILFTQKNYSKLAELILFLKEDVELQKKILAKQKEALEYYINFPWTEELVRIFLNKKQNHSNYLTGKI